MNYKIILFLLTLFSTQQWLTAQVTNAHIWVNEFHYDGQSDRGTTDSNQFIELVVHNDILANPDEAAKIQLVLYTTGGVRYMKVTEEGRGIPYNVTGPNYSEAETNHTIGDEDTNGDTGFQRCEQTLFNYTILTKNLPALQDLPTAFAIIYDNTEVIQLISYEESFKMKNHPEAGAAADMTSTLIATAGGTALTENTATDNSCSIYMDGTGNSYDSYSWTQDLQVVGQINLCNATPCAVNSGQTITNLDCIPPSLAQPADQTACNSYTLPAIEGSFLTGNEKYYTDSQDNNGLPIIGNEITSTTTVWIYDANVEGTCSDEISFLVTIGGALSLDPIAAQMGCDNFTLPAIQGSAVSSEAAYYTQTGGTGTKFVAGDVVTQSYTPLYIYDGTPSCNVEESFNLTISPTPQIDDIPNPEVCDQFILPAISGAELSTGASYYTAPNGGGTALATGAAITSPMTVYIYDDNGGCTAEQSFTVNVVPTPQINAISNATDCNSYTLPAITGTNLTGNEAYYTQPNGQGQMIRAGMSVTQSQTLYIYDRINNCSNEQSFDVTINEFIAGSAGMDQTIAAGDDVAPFTVNEASSGAGTFTYQWQSRPENSGFTDITSANDAGYDEGVINETMYYRRMTIYTFNSVSCTEMGETITVTVDNSNTVPIEWLYVAARPVNKQTLVEWATATETNVSGYFVEWSVDGETFNQLGFVAAKNRATTYEFTHQKPLAGRNYYRIQQVDLDRSIDYSKTLVVNIESDINSTSLLVYPNPSTGTIQLELPTTFDLSQSNQVNIYNRLGQLVLQTQLSTDSQVDLAPFANGTYHIEVIQNALRSVGQVVKIN